MGAQRALGFASGAAGIVEAGDVVGAGERARCRMAGGLDRSLQVDAVIGGTECENGFEARGFGREIAAAIAKAHGVDHQHLGLGILKLE